MNRLISQCLKKCDFNPNYIRTIWIEKSKCRKHFPKFVFSTEECGFSCSVLCSLSHLLLWWISQKSNANLSINCRSCWKMLKKDEDQVEKIIISLVCIGIQNLQLISFVQIGKNNLVLNLYFYVNLLNFIIL